MYFYLMKNKDHYYYYYYTIVFDDKERKRRNSTDWKHPVFKMHFDVVIMHNLSEARD